MTYAMDLLVWAWCALASWMVSVLPVTRRAGLLDRFTLWLLPFAGFYAYHDPESGSTWRWSKRARVRPAPGDGAPF